MVMAFSSNSRGFFRLLLRSLPVLSLLAVINLLLFNVKVANNSRGEEEQRNNIKTTHFVLHTEEERPLTNRDDIRPMHQPKLLLNFTANVNSSTLLDGNGFPQIWVRLPGLINSMLIQLRDNNKPLCPVISNKLVGWTNISAKDILKEKRDAVEYRMIQSGVKAGGRCEPSECRAGHKIAVVVPVRNRTQHLTIFTRYIHPFLQRQQLDYTIVVVEQSRGSPFNRGMLMNIGFKEALLLDREIQCFFFHDVDMLPEHDGNPYTCPEDGQPRQIKFYLDKWDDYTYMNTDYYFGGVTAFTTGDFQKINGFSNVFWGWGGEDNDLLKRVQINNMTAKRTFDNYPSLIHMARYKTLAHQKSEPSPDRRRLFHEGSKRIAYDGLANLVYERIDLQLKLLYTHVFVDIQQTAPSRSMRRTVA